MFSKVDKSKCDIASEMYLTLFAHEKDTQNFK